jgi:hypothetical protein
MSYQESANAVEAVTKNVIGAGLGAMSAMCGKPMSPIERSTNPFTPLGAEQVGSAMTVALMNGAGASGAIVAGVGVVTAKVAVVTAAVVTVGPAIVLASAVTGLGYAIYKLLK